MEPQFWGSIVQIIIYGAFITLLLRLMYDDDEPRRG